MSEKEFVDGLLVKPPVSGAPDFVKCAISIKRKDLGNWLRGKEEDWINIDVKVSKGGKWYAEVNNWKPGQEQAPQQAAPQPAPADFDDDIPF